MDGAKLARMANQIAAFFAAEPDAVARLEGVANHLHKFWEPRMRREILARLDADGDHGLDALVVEALRTHRQRLTPQPA